MKHFSYLFVIMSAPLHGMLQQRLPAHATCKQQDLRAKQARLQAQEAQNEKALLSKLRAK